MAIKKYTNELFVEDEGTHAEATLTMLRGGDGQPAAPVTWLIWSLYTPPEFRNMGGAGRVMQQIADFLDEDGRDARLSAQPFPRMTYGKNFRPNIVQPSLALDQLIAFYERYGFKVMMFDTEQSLAVMVRRARAKAVA